MLCVVRSLPVILLLLSPPIALRAALSSARLVFRRAVSSLSLSLSPFALYTYTGIATVHRVFALRYFPEVLARVYLLTTRARCFPFVLSAESSFRFC